MKITRTINGKEYTFELTNQEIEKAFREQELYYKTLDIQSQYQKMYNKECPYDQNLLEKIAQDVEDHLSNNTPYWDDFWASFEMVIEEFEESRKGEI